MLPLVKATYLARACGAASLAPSKNGNMQIAVPCEISQGEYAGEVITWIAVLHDTPDKNGTTGTERSIASLQYMGWQGDDISELVDVSDDIIKTLLPDEVSLACDVETYDGKTRLKVQWVNKPGAGRFAFKEALGGGDLKSFAAQLKSTVRSVRGASGSRPAGNGTAKPTQPTTPTQKDMDDIPF